MNIAQALKNKARLVGQINRLNGLIKSHNVHREGSPKLNVADLLLERENLKIKLMVIRARIADANAGIQHKLVGLAEAKDELSFYESVPVNVGVERDYDDDGKIINVPQSAFFTLEMQMSKVRELQDAINNLQDEIVTYNATTTVAE